MIPVLRSIDSLLNRFDELSQQHTNFIESFQTSFNDIENPLHDVSRNEEEQRKTTENLLKATTTENNGQIGSVEDFNRRITKSRSHNRPPSYCSNDSTAYFHRVPSRSSLATTESAPPPRILTAVVIQPKMKSSISQPVTVVSTSLENLLEPKLRLTTKIKPKVIPQNSSPPRKYARGTITTFTMETVNRLSRPKTYQSPEKRASPKRFHRKQKIYQNITKELPMEVSIPLVSLPPPPPPRSPHIKRTNPTLIRSSPKKLKSDNKFSIDDSKRIPASNYPHPVIHLVPPPTICLTFPMQPELKSSRVVVTPKTPPTKKTFSIFTKRKAIIDPHRMIHILT